MGAAGQRQVPEPADGGCDGSDKAIEKWKAWMAAGYTSSTDA
jgi:hypothetical protein